MSDSDEPSGWSGVSRRARVVEAVGWRRACRSLLAFCLSVGAVALWSASAQALIERGHVFGFSFAGAGSGAGQLAGPGEVAVNEATGDVYVVDRANSRIERFGAGGEFIAVWGWGVSDGKEEYEVCESGCQAGIAGDQKGQFRSPGAIAVDNSSSLSDPSRGSVYVVTDARVEHSHIVKFSAAGEPLSSLKQAGVEAKWEGALDGVAVDGSGRLWVYRGVEAEGFIERFSDAVKNKFEEPALESTVFCPKPGFAIDTAGELLYGDHERENHEGGCPVEEGEAARPVVTAQLGKEGEALETRLGALDPLQSTAVATEAFSGNVYVSNVGTVAAFDSAGSLIERFSLPGEHAAGGGVAVNAASGEVYVSDAATAMVDVFEAEPPGRPTVSALSAQNLTPTSARLSAQLDPTGADTHYYFQYGTVDCVESPASCTDAPAPPGTDAGAGFSDQSASVELQGLEPSTTYYYRIIAANEHGEAQGSESFGSITTLPSAQGLLADQRAWELVSPPEKDGSSIEPLRNEGGLIQASEDGSSITYVANSPIVPEPEGNRAPYPTQALATRSPSGWSSQQIVTPRTKGEGFIPGEAPEYRYFSADLSLSLVQPDNQALVEPLEQPPLAPEASEKTMYLRDSATGEYLPLVTASNDTAGSKFGQKLEFAGATADLSHVVFSSEVPLTSGSGAGLYEWQARAPLTPVSVLPDGSAALEPALGANGHNVRGAISADGTRVFWTGSEELTGKTTETVRHLFMRNTATNKTLQLDAATPPVQEPGEEESEVGFQGASADGTRVFFTDTARLTEDSKLAPLPGSTTNPADLYECEITEVSAKPSCKLSDLTVDQRPSESAAVLDLVPAISQDGSYLYFVANGVLAPGATPGGCVRMNTEAPPPGASCNLYLYHSNKITFIASLSDEDAPDWGRSEADIKGGESSVEPLQNLSDVTVGVSPDGRYLAFMSNRSLTGYDNVDANPAGKGARDEEVYLYDASSKLLVCASCNPSGERPHGVYDSENSGEGLGLLVDRRGDWTDKPKTPAPTAHWLAGSIPGWTPLGWASVAQALRQPRYLSDAGRLFFNSADALVTVEHSHTRQETINGEAVQVGVESVYQYERSGSGTCKREEGCVSLISSGTSQQESAFLDASANGNDAFFLTAQPLVSADRDTNFDLYDARVCTAGSPCLTSQAAPPSPCESTDSCRPAPGAEPGPLGPSGSATYSGPGNAGRHEARGLKEVEAPSPKPLTQAQKLAAALKVCRSKYKRSASKRAACERQARKRYPIPLTQAQKLSNALKACRSKYKRSASKRVACERQARKRYPAKKAATSRRGRR